MGMIRRAVPLLLLLSCLSEPIGDSNQRVGVDRGGVRLIGGDSLAVASSATSCDVLSDCCDGDPDCLDYVDTLSEPQCEELLQGDASECVGQNGGGSGDDCCQAGDPCGWADDGSCDCPDDFWDFSDCNGGEGEAEAEAEAEAEPDCCSPGDPCDLAFDGWCDCPEQDWEQSDCGLVPDAEVVPDAGPVPDF